MYHAGMDNVQIFPWTSKLDTGIAEVDEQHQRLVQLINVLAHHFAHQAELPALDAIFEELFHYADYHFTSEESLWSEYFPGDPWQSEHRGEHLEFVHKLQALWAKRESTPLAALLEEMLAYLTHWLCMHILDSDRRLAKVVLLMRDGCALAEAKVQADRWSRGSGKVVLDTVLGMYSKLSGSTLRLMKEMITRQKIEARLSLTANVFDNAFESICILDTDGLIVQANPAFCQICQRAQEELVGRPLYDFKSGLADPALAARVWAAAKEAGHWSGELLSRAPGGELYAELLSLSAVRNADDELVSFVAVFSNVGELIRREQSLRQLATHDALTGLPNRLLFADRLKLALANAERTGTALAVCYLDLDGFKPVNDAFGHAAGDEVLRQVAERLTQLLRGNDTVARLGGDEFVILAGGLQQPEAVAGLCERILSVVALPIAVAGTTVQVSASIGFSLFPDDSRSAETLLEQADRAMYQAKRSGGARSHRYRPD